MTIITIAKTENEIAIAGDTQITCGNWHLKKTAEYQVHANKFLYYGKSILGVAGDVAIRQSFEDLMSHTDPTPFSSRQEIFRWLLLQHSKLKGYCSGLKQMEDFPLKNEV